MGQVIHPLFLLLRTWWEKGALLPHAYTGEGREAVAVYICGDCDKFPRMFHLLQTAYRTPEQVVVGEWARTHVIALNGGGLCLSPAWPQAFDRRAMRASTELAYRKKGVRKFDLVPHFLCGMAGELQLSPREVACHLRLAVGAVQAAYPDCEVRLKPVIDWPPDFVPGLCGPTLHHLSLEVLGEGAAETQVAV